MFLLLVWIMLSAIIPTQLQAEAMKASPHPFVVEQDDEEIILKFKGDEHQHWITDEDDYTVVRNNNGDYTYAKLSKDKKRLLPTDEKVGKSSKKGSKKSKNIKPAKTNNDEYQNDGIILESVPAVITPSKLKWQKRCNRGGGGSCDQRLVNNPFSGSNQHTDIQYNQTDTLDYNYYHRRTAAQPVNKTLYNLVFLLMFDDHKNREVPSREDISILMNSEVVDKNIAPTGSLKMIYWENSYGKLTIESEVTDWIVLDNTESYYAGGESAMGMDRRFHQALKDALYKLETDGFDFKNFDVNKDGNIDSITFLTSGYGAEWGQEGFQDRIWSHKWIIFGGWESSSGVRVTDYHVSPALWGTSGKAIGRVGVIAHEIGHFLNLPDLYGTDGSGNGLGFFCLMANSWGYDGSQLYPPQMSAWSKMKIGWTEPQIPSIGVENRVARAEGSATSNAPHQMFKIGDGQFGYPEGEYFLVEFRQTSWLIGGIAIYHVDEKMDSYNTAGYPGQEEWPSNGKHYKIALIAADGMFELERNINQGNSADLYGIGQSLLPSKDANGPFPNTDSYQYGINTRTGVRICVTSDIDRSYMTFLFSDGTLNQPWMMLVSEKFENSLSDAFAFVLNAKVVQNEICSGCVQIKNNVESSMLVTVEITCLTELRVSFNFYSTGLRRGKQLHLEYYSAGGSNDEWVALDSWTKGDGTSNTFRNKRWFSKSVDLSLTDTQTENIGTSYVVFRFSSSSMNRKYSKILIDNLEIEGKF